MNYPYIPLLRVLFFKRSIIVDCPDVFPMMKHIANYTKKN